MRVAWRAPAPIVLAVPVAPPETLAELGKEADEVVSLGTPPLRGAIGFYYHDFNQMSNSEVTDLLPSAVLPVVPAAPSPEQTTAAAAPFICGIGLIAIEIECPCVLE
jgi:hypothetical protein